MHPKNISISDYAYNLPDEKIAAFPLADRDSSKLLVYKDSQVQQCVYENIAQFLPEKSLLVFNDTKVIPARLFGKKQSGGKVEILIERILDDHHAIAHARSSKTAKPGTLIELDGGYSCEVLCRADDLFQLEFKGEHSLLYILEQIGHIPLPPYITREDDQSDLTRYQTVFAREAGAVAAPTAGLHFDQAMMEKA